MNLQVIDEREILNNNFKIYGNLENPVFLAKDVANWIGHTNVTDMMSIVDEEEKLTSTVPNSGQNRKMWFLTEDGLYEVLMQSRKPIAKKFKKEVKKILKDIRKNGMYATDELLDNPDLLIEVATKLKEEKERNLLLTKTIEKQKPQVVFASAIETSQNSIAVKVLATILKQNGIDIGQNRMFQWLRDNKYLSSRPGKSWNMPTQKSMDLGLFELKANPYFHSNGEIENSYTPLVTGKGQVYFVNKFAKVFKLTGAAK